MEHQKAGPLEISEDASFQKREWRVQRVGWLLMALLALCALAGFFGRGPAARTTVSNSTGSLIVHYERIARHDAATRLEVFLPSSSGEVGLWLDRRLLEDFELQNIIPQPVRTSSTESGSNFFFDVAPRAALTLLLEPRQIGRHHSRLGLLADTSAVTLRYLILP